MHLVLISNLCLATFVPVDQRDYLRFYWYHNNDSSQPLVPYRSTSHVFGCVSSPAVASFGLKFCASADMPDNYIGAGQYIRNNIYVDDGLYSANTEEEAVDILSKARELLSTNLRLHKIISNSKNVLKHFPESELAMEVEKLELQSSSIQQTLGISLDANLDVFTVEVNPPDKSSPRGD